MACKPGIAATPETEVSFVPMADVAAGYMGGMTPTQKNWAQAKSGFSRFADGDVILAQITPCFQNRKSAICTGLTSVSSFGSAEFQALRSCIKTDKVYLSEFARGIHIVAYGVENCKGSAGQKRPGTREMLNYPVPSPPLAEQRRIVARPEELLPEVAGLVGSKITRRNIMSTSNPTQLMQDAINDILDSKKEKYDKCEFNIDAKLYEDVLYTFDIIEKFKMCNFSDVDERYLLDVTNHINKLKNILDFLSQSKSTVSPVNTKTISASTRAIKDFFIMWGAFIICNKKYLYSSNEYMNSKYNTLENEAKENLKKVEELSKDAEEKIKQFVGAMQTLAGERAVESFSDVFEESARESAANAKFWGWLLVGCTVATVVALLWIVSATIGEGSSDVPLQFIVSRAIVIIVCMSASLWCGRMYKSEKHQQALKEHNKHIIKSFKAFMSASSFPVHTSVILWEATRTVFGEFDTGYFNFDKKNTIDFSDMLKTMIVKQG